MVTRLRRQDGHTLIEMVVTISILGILATVALPIASVTRKREKEIELRRHLREIRSAIDMYHDACKVSLGQASGGGLGNAAGNPPPPSPLGGQRPATLSRIIIKIEDDPGGTCYPKDLDVLIEGVETDVPRYKLKFLRRIPRDPFNVHDDEHDMYGWVLRATTDDPERDTGWNKQNVFDVRSASESHALDGSRYKDW